MLNELIILSKEDKTMETNLEKKLIDQYCTGEITGEQFTNEIDNEKELGILITKEQLSIAWGNADFGNVEKRDVIKYSLLKYAGGGDTGNTAKRILQDLSLLTKKNNLSAFGKLYLHTAFKHRNYSF